MVIRRMTVHLTLPSHSFVLDRIAITYNDFDEAELGRQLIKGYRGEPIDLAIKADLGKARLTAHARTLNEYTEEGSLMADFWIVAQFEDDDDAALFMLKHNIQPQRYLEIEI